MTPTRRILLNAAVAAVYAVLTVGLAPLSYGPVQVRISECLTLLAYNNKNYLPGLILGGCIANFGSPIFSSVRPPRRLPSALCPGYIISMPHLLFPLL